MAVVVGVGWLVLRPAMGLPPGPWTVGVNVPLSGEFAPDSIAVRNAVQLAVDEANEAGGAAGVELSVTAHDSAGEFPDDPIGPRPTPGRWRTIRGRSRQSARTPPLPESARSR